MQNIDIRKLEDDIINVLNKSNVLIECKRLVISNVLNIVTKEADKAILEELSTLKKENDKNDELGK